MHILPNTTSMCASVTKETYQPQHKIITTDPYAKKKINKQNIRYLKFDSTWFLGINYFMLKAEKGGGGYCAGIFLRKKNSMLVKKIFYSPQCPRIRFWSLNSPVLSHEFIGLIDFFIHLMCGKKNLHTDHEKKILSS